jgi:hypothetical protein
MKAILPARAPAAADRRGGGQAGVRPADKVPAALLSALMVRREGPDRCSA